jgi:hypothetical protein
MAGAAVNFGGATLAGSVATFGGQMTPYCNYTSPLAKKFIYKEQNKIFYPLRRHIFRMKVRTAAEIRFFELQKQFMCNKPDGVYGKTGMTMTNNMEFDHMGSIIPKDQYEVKKMTSYMTTRKLSDDYKNAMQEIWTKMLFVCESTNNVGKIENIAYQYAKPATDEEFMAWMWYMIALVIAFSTVFTTMFWWYKYGQQPQYVDIK